MELKESDLTKDGDEKRKKKGDKKDKPSFGEIARKTLGIIIILGIMFSVGYVMYKDMKQTFAPEPKAISSAPQIIFTNMSANDATTAAFVSIINQSGGIPISIKTETNWSQFAISLLFGSLFMLWIFGDMLRMSVKNLIMKSYFSFLKKKTGRHILFIKHTEAGLFSQSMIDQSTLNKIQKALIKFKGKPFDLILHTPGGEVFSAMFISRLFKEYPGEIRSVVPMYAMSGGTLLALSTEELHMSPTSCLGPVDPQLGNLFRYGSAKSWDHIVKFKGKKAEDQSISFAMIGNQYTKTIRTHLMNNISFPMDPEAKKKFVEFLTTGDVEHAFALTPGELAKMGVPVKIIKDDTLLTRMIKFIVNTGNEGVTYV